MGGALLTNLAKVFDCILHRLLIGKPSAYGFDYNSVQMLQSYLSNRKQITKINYAYCKYCEILFGVPHGSISGPLLFNIYICDMFYGIASYADDKTPYASSSNLDALVNKLLSCRKKRPGTFISFQENFDPRHAYSSHPLYLFLKLFPPIQFISDAFFSLFRNIKSRRNKTTSL